MGHGATWTLQVCPVCGWTVLDDNAVRDADDDTLGQECEAWMCDSDIPQHGACRVVTVAELGGDGWVEIGRANGFDGEMMVHVARDPVERWVTLDWWRQHGGADA